VPGNGEIPITGGTDTPEPATSLVNTQWQLVSYGEAGMETPVIEESEVLLQFESDNQLEGYGGCNMFTAGYQAPERGKLSISNIVSTLVACADTSVMEQEERYFEALRTVGSYELTGDRLKLWYDGRISALNFTRFTSDSPLDIP
jgi:heat shock protein HslJ